MGAFLPPTGAPCYEGVYWACRRSFVFTPRWPTCVVLFRLQWNRRSLTLPDEPVVTLRPPVRSTRLHTR